MARGKGEGSISFDVSKQLWVGRIDLPTHEFDRMGRPIRRRKVIRRKDKAVLIREMKKLHKRLEESGDMPTASQTVASWFDYWVNEVAGQTRRPSTMNSYRSVVRNVITPHLGKTRLDDLRPTHIRAMNARLEKNGAKSTTIRNVFSILSAGLTDAERDGRITRNPCTLMDPPRKAKAELEVLEANEVKRILASLDGSPDMYLWATYMLTGARRGEVLGLEWDRINPATPTTPATIDMSWQLQRIIWQHGCGPTPKKGEAAACGYKRAASCPDKRLDMPKDYEYRHIHGGLYWTRPKSSAGWRVIPLVDPLKSWLEEWRGIAPTNKFGLVFAVDGAPIDPDKTSRTWVDVRKGLGVTRNIRLHDLRHGAIDLMYSAQVPEADIIRIFGHSTVQMSRSYRSAGNREREAIAMQRMSESLGFLQLDS